MAHEQFKLDTTISRLVMVQNDDPRPVYSNQVQRVRQLLDILQIYDEGIKCRSFWYDWLKYDYDWIKTEIVFIPFSEIKEFVYENQSIAELRVAAHAKHVAEEAERLTREAEEAAKRKAAGLFKTTRRHWWKFW